MIADLKGRLQQVVGSGRQGSADGELEKAEFNHPQGLALHDGILYVADTENHLIRKVDLGQRRVITMAGNGKQARVVAKRASTFPRGTESGKPLGFVDPR